jgi:hypothetical protein
MTGQALESIRLVSMLTVLECAAGGEHIPEQAVYRPVRARRRCSGVIVSTRRTVPATALLSNSRIEGGVAAGDRAGCDAGLLRRRSSADAQTGARRRACLPAVPPVAASSPPSAPSSVPAPDECETCSPRPTRLGWACSCPPSRKRLSWTSTQYSWPSNSTLSCTPTTPRTSGPTAPFVSRSGGARHALGEGGDAFTVEMAMDLFAADELNPHNTRLIARRPR